MSEDRLIILGASTRAAAFSAMRAGFEPWCADRFADADLTSRCASQRVPAELYPEALEHMVRTAPPGPWMYTGGLEHYPDLIDRIREARPLWGNPGSVLRLARSPEHLRDVLKNAGLPSPRLGNDGCNPASGWLVKPRRGQGQIRHWTGEPIDGEHYLQEKIAGDSIAALFIASHERTDLLGVTRQLVGEAWLHAPPYRYCGSVGPLQVAGKVQESLIALGQVLRAGLGLVGLFGVDCLLLDQTIWPVEVNPRYTASVEILEYASGQSFLADHAAVFRSDSEPRPRRSGTATAVSTPEVSRSAPLSPRVGGRGQGEGGNLRTGNGTSSLDRIANLGKAILYAHQPITVPVSGPWTEHLDYAIDRMPPFADIPHPGERIEPGEPVLTFFDSGPDCLARLKKLAGMLDCALTKAAT